MQAAAQVLGRGLIAGLVGTAVMTAAQVIAAKMSGQGGESFTPADAAEKVGGVRGAKGEQERKRLNNAVNWAYGTGWGVPYASLRRSWQGPHNGPRRGSSGRRRGTAGAAALRTFRT